MKCPYCGRPSLVYGMNSDVRPGRYRIDPFTVRRYRRCPAGHHFRSIERVAWDKTLAPVVGEVA